MTDLLSKLFKWTPKSNGLEYSRLGSTFLVSYLLILFLIFGVSLGASWRVLAPLGMAPPDASCRLLTFLCRFFASWRLLARLGVSWRPLAPLGASWRRLAPLAASWRLLALLGAS